MTTIREIRAALAELEPEREMLIGQQGADSPHAAMLVSQVERDILGALKRLVPSAALSYEQALRDLAEDRLSYRGTANELREALREVLDELAPDEDVEAQPGFQHEQDLNKPTQRQKVQYILKSQGISAASRKTAEDSVSLVEELTSSLARSTYTRSNFAAHMASARREVRSLKMYFDSVLAELLETHR